MVLPGETEIEIPLLEGLIDIGGQGRPKDIYPLVTKKFPQISGEELAKTLKTGGNRWKNRIQWTRLRLIKKGDMFSPSRGIWAITDKGRKRVEDKEPQVNARTYFGARAQMESIFNTISIKNFRPLKSIKELNLKPITLLVGANSSGKTAVLQTILMLKQTLESRNIDAPLVVRGKYVDLNSYRDIIFKHELNKNIEIELNIKLDENKFRGYEDIKNIVKINLSEILNSINISYAFGYDKKMGIIKNQSFEICHKNIFKAVYKGRNVLNINYLDSVISYETKNGQLFEIKNFMYIPITDQYIHRTIMEYLSNSERKHHLETRKKEVNERIGQMTLDGKKLSARAAARLEAFNSRLEFYQSQLSMMDERTEEILGSYDISEMQIIDFILKLIKESMLRVQQTLLERTYYIGPLRDWPQRYYFTSGERPRDVGLGGEYTIDVIFYGFLNNKERSNKLSYWMKKMELAETIQLEQITEGIYTLLVGDPNLDIKITLADIGFGASQVLPIIVEGFYARENSLLLIEQPEIHLHPKLQSALCDLLIDIVKENKQVIVETHSEHLILRLQRRIAENVISHKDVSLLYFETSKNGTIITDIELDENGLLTRWPKGFFEEDVEESMLFLKALGEREK